MKQNITSSQLNSIIPSEYFRSKNSREELIKISSSTTAKLASISQEVANIVDQSKNTLDVLGKCSTHLGL